MNLLWFCFAFMAIRIIDCHIKKFHCHCTIRYKYAGNLVLDVCKRWSKSNYKWCYLAGGPRAASCPGAKKSDKGDYYWTSDKKICEAKRCEPKCRHGICKNGKCECDEKWTGVDCSKYKCHCTSRYKYEAWCQRWGGSNFKWCYLSGGLRAAKCPGARKSVKGKYYWTSDKKICETPVPPEEVKAFKERFNNLLSDAKSCEKTPQEETTFKESQNLGLNCHCTSRYKNSGTQVYDYCDRWGGSNFKWCYLAGGPRAASCPGAKKSGKRNYYWTSDKKICEAPVPPEEVKALGKRFHKLVAMVKKCWSKPWVAPKFGKDTRWSVRLLLLPQD